MTGILISLLKRIADNLFHRVPTLYQCIEEQCHIAIQAMEIFMNYLRDGHEENLVKIKIINRHRNEIYSRTYNILNSESAIPVDIKAIYRAFLSLDMMIYHIRISTEDIKMQQLNPDRDMLQMTSLLKLGIESLQRGFKKLTTNPLHAQEDAHTARNAANDTRNAFTRALADISLTEEHNKRLSSNKKELNAKITTTTIANLKRRMIYSDLSKIADQVTWASEQLYHLSAK